MKELLCQELGLQGLLSEEERSHREAIKARKKSQASLCFNLSCVQWKEILMIEFVIFNFVTMILLCVSGSLSYSKSYRGCESRNAIMRTSSFLRRVGKEN